VGDGSCGKAGRVVGGAHDDGAAVGEQIVDAVGNGDAAGVGAEVMIVDLDRGAIPASARVFEVGNTADVEFSGMTITAGTSMTAGAINNNGLLKLTNVNIDKNAAVNGATLVENKNNGQLTIIGSCSINQ